MSELKEINQKIEKQKAVVASAEKNLKTLKKKYSKELYSQQQMYEQDTPSSSLFEIAPSKDAAEQKLDEAKNLIKAEKQKHDVLMRQAKAVARELEKYKMF